MANVLLCPADKKKKFVWIELNRPLSFDRSGVTWPPLRRFHWAKNVRLFFVGTFRLFWIWIFFYPIMAVDEDEKNPWNFCQKVDQSDARHWNAETLEHSRHSFTGTLSNFVGEDFFFWDVRRSLTRGDGDTASAPTHRQLADQVSPLAAS